ncbi:MAG: sulfatase-like hydrolase/transferase [Candidatus Lokiarchaeota archaeon]|nr:sulfatase-like hydrolase/transferase [Candidatus Lokiarchaeota archaeon]
MKNVILIVIDTLASKHLGCYGYKRETSPNLDNFARDAIIFDNAYANNNATHPSFTTILTGRHPLSHQIVAHQGNKKMNKDIPTIARILSKNGYKTVGFDNMYKWFKRGFEDYNYPSFKNKFWHGISPSYTSIGATQLTNKIIDWVKKYRERLDSDKEDRNFFMFLHYWDPHFPYLPPRKYRRVFYNGNKKEKNNNSMEPVKDFIGWFLLNIWVSSDITDIEWIKALYDSEIKYLDDNLGRLFDALKEYDFYDDSLIIFTADHGEIMEKKYDNDQGIYFMHFLLLDETINVPFIVRYNNEYKGEKISALVQHADIVPTILDYTGIKSKDSFDGKSFLPLITRKADKLHDKICALEHTALSKRALVTKKWKYITTIDDTYLRGTPFSELYNRNNDKKEENNLIEQEPEIARELDEKLKKYSQEIIDKAKLEYDPQIDQDQAIKEISGYKFLIWLFGRMLYSSPRK